MMGWPALGVLRVPRVGLILVWFPPRPWWAAVTCASTCLTTAAQAPFAKTSPLSTWVRPQAPLQEGSRPG